MQRISLLAGVTALLAACAAVPEPQYETDHPANPAAAPATPDSQAGTLNSYHLPAGPSTPSENHMDHSQMKRGAPKGSPANSKEGGGHDH